MTFDPSAPASTDSGIFGLDTPPEESAVVLIPVPFDATTSYGQGTCDGPATILQASRQVDLFDIECGRPYEAGISMLPIPGDVRAWNDKARKLVEPARQGNVAALAEVNKYGHLVNEWVYEQAHNWIKRGRTVGVIGGDHSTPFGTIRAHAEAYPNLGVLHVDAHADLRHAYEGFTWSHASIMHNVIDHTAVKKLVQVGIRDFCEDERNFAESSRGRIKVFYDRDIAAAGFEGVPFKQTVDSILNELPDDVYVSFDIDGLDPLLCPHTGTPVPGGLSFHQAVYLLGAITRAGKRLVGFDLNEVAPGPEGDEWDGNVGARLLYKMCGFAQLGRKEAP